MSLSEPDAAFWRYLELQRRLNAVVARPLVPTRTLRFSDRCPQCEAHGRSARLEEFDPETGASRWVCGECEGAWPVDVAFLLRPTELRPTGEDAGDRRAEQIRELGRLRTILGRLPRREQVIYLLLTLYEGRRDLSEVAEQMNSRFPQFAPPHGERGPRPDLWREWTARRVIASARQMVRRELYGL